MHILCSEFALCSTVESPTFPATFSLSLSPFPPSLSSEPCARPALIPSFVRPVGLGPPRPRAAAALIRHARWIIAQRREKKSSDSSSSARSSRPSSRLTKTHRHCRKIRLNRRRHTPENRDIRFLPPYLLPQQQNAQQTPSLLQPAFSPAWPGA